MIHGRAGSSRQYRRIALRLTEEGYRCVVIDLPAHGIEAGGSTHAYEMADAIEMAGNALGKVDIVVAHSPGAMATAVDATWSGFVYERSSSTCAAAASSGGTWLLRACVLVLRVAAALLDKPDAVVTVTVRP